MPEHVCNQANWQQSTVIEVSSSMTAELKNLTVYFLLLLQRWRCLASLQALAMIDRL